MPLPLRLELLSLAFSDTFLASFPSCQLCCPSSFSCFSAASRKPRSHLSLPKLLVRFPLVNIVRPIKRSRLLAPDRDIDVDTDTIFGTRFRFGQLHYRSAPIVPAILWREWLLFFRSILLSFVFLFFFLSFSFLSFLVHVCECVKVRTNVSIGVVEMKYLEKLRVRCCGLRNQVIASSKGKVRKSYNCLLQAVIVFNAQLYLDLIRKSWWVILEVKSCRYIFVHSGLRKYFNVYHRKVL